MTKLLGSTAESVYEAIGDEWLSVADLKKKTKYAPGTLRTFLPQLVEDGVVLSKRQPSRSGMGRPTLLYKAVPEDHAFLVRTTLETRHSQVQRTLRILPGASIREFVLTINAAMGWENAHLHEISSKEIRVPIDQALDAVLEHELWRESSDKRKEVWQYSDVAALLFNIGDKAVYRYDFGDEWEHRVELIDIVPAIGDEPYLVDASEECPEEDSGYGNPMAFQPFRPFQQQSRLAPKRLSYYRKRLAAMVKSPVFARQPAIDIVADDPLTAAKVFPNTETFRAELLKAFRVLANGQVSIAFTFCKSECLVDVLGMFGWMPIAYTLKQSIAGHIAKSFIHAKGNKMPTSDLRLRIDYYPANDDPDYFGTNKAGQEFEAWLIRQTGPTAKAAQSEYSEYIKKWADRNTKVLNG